LTPHDFGTVEQCQKIKIEDLVSDAKQQIKQSLIKSRLDTMGMDIALLTSQTNNGGLRLWFACPVCGMRVGTLYFPPGASTIACRTCLGLKYRKSRYKGMIEGE